jgi:hypothetical protein
MDKQIEWRSNWLVKGAQHEKFAASAQHVFCVFSCTAWQRLCAGRMHIPGLTLLDAPPPQPPLSEHEQHVVTQQLLEAPNTAAAVDDQGAVHVVEATEQLPAVYQDGAPSLLEETQVKSESCVNKSDNLDALDLALAQESASEPESDGSESGARSMGEYDPSRAHDGMEEQEDNKNGDTDDTDEGFRFLIAMRLTVVGQPHPRAMMTKPHQP